MLTFYQVRLHLAELSHEEVLAGLMKLVPAGQVESVFPAQEIGKNYNNCGTQLLAP